MAISKKTSPQETWILNAVIATQNNSRSVRKGHLRIINGRIAAITNTRPGKISKKAKVINADGLTLVPGFVQAHVHLCQTLFRNLADDLELMDWLSKRIWIFEAAHTPETLRTSARLGIHELLSSGTTALLDMGTIRHTDAIFEAVKESGIRASVGKCLMDHPENTPEYLREPTQRAIQEAVKLFEKWNGAANDRIRASFAPRFVISCTDELLREVVKLASDRRAVIHTHASENRKEIEIVRGMTGMENVEYLHHIGMTSPQLVLAHCIWLNEKEIEILRTTGTHAVHCPSSNMKLASGLAKVPHLRECGVNVALGADGAPCNNNLDMFGEMRLAALLHKPGLGPKTMRAQEAFDMATRDGAKALGWFEDIGTIEVDKKADLVALDLNTPSNTVPSSDALSPEAIASSIVYSTRPSEVRWTMVDGKIVYKDGKVTAIPRDKLVADVHKAQQQILKKTKNQRI